MVVQTPQMFRWIPYILLIHGSVCLQGQAIEGVVYDQETGRAIELADIYFDGTFRGTISDSAGRFRLDISGYENRAVTVGAMGYYTQTYPVVITESMNFVCLVPRSYQIKEVTVNARSLVSQRRKNLQIFRKEFLGSSGFARSCRILNEDELTFNYGSDQDTLRAMAYGPIQVINQALGYEISYYMEDFTYDRNSGSTRFIGTIVYKKDLAGGFETGRMERRRRNAYSGSCLHFFRALWHNTLEDTPFVVRNDTEDRLGYSDLVQEGANGVKYLSYPESLDIYYFTTWSRVDFLADRVPFESSGFFDPEAIAWKGRMGDLRAGDWLPYDYSPEK